MKNIKQLSIILVILFLGQVIQQRYNTSVPGTILGMMILLLLLMVKIIKLERIENITKILLDHISLFFVPPVVAIMTLFDQVKDIWVSLLVILILSTIIVMGVTGATVQFINKHIINKRKRGD